MRIALAIILALLACTAASGDIIYSDTAAPTGSTGHDSVFHAIVEVTMDSGSAHRDDGMITVPLHDSFGGPRTLTMYIFSADGVLGTSYTDEGHSSLGDALFSSTIVTPDLGIGIGGATSVTFDFTGFTLPDSFFIMIDVDDGAGTVFWTFDGAATGPTIGTYVSFTATADDGVTITAPPAATVTFNVIVTAVPEPSSYALAGLLLLGFAVQRRRRRDAA